MGFARPQQFCIQSDTVVSGWQTTKRYGLHEIRTFRISRTSKYTHLRFIAKHRYRLIINVFLSLPSQGGLVFVCGSRDGLMTVSGRKHNADDIIATVLAVEPMKFIYRGRIAVFSIRVLRDERICVIAEQRPECSEEEVGWT